MSVRILAVDTATEACSAAVMIDDAIMERFTVEPRAHTKHILSMVDSLLVEAGIALENLNAIAFSQGPGSFAGISIGLGIAKGLALGTDLPLIGISTLATLAQGAWRKTGEHQVLTAMDARMGEIYCAQYCKNTNNIWLGEYSEKVLKPDTFKTLTIGLTGSWAIAGTGWQIYPELVDAIISSHNSMKPIIDGAILFPSAQDMLPLALHQWHNGSTKSANLAQPIYLRHARWKKLPGKGK